METGKHFHQYDKVKRGKKEGGKVYISCAANGEVGFHEGWLDEKEAARIDKAKAKAEAKGERRGRRTDKAPAKPELTKAAIRYLDLHRQNAVRVELLKSPADRAAAHRGERRQQRRPVGRAPGAPVRERQQGDRRIRPREQGAGRVRGRTSGRARAARTFRTRTALCSSRGRCRPTRARSSPGFSQ